MGADASASEAQVLELLGVGGGSRRDGPVQTCLWSGGEEIAQKFLGVFERRMAAPVRARRSEWLIGCDKYRLDIWDQPRG